MADTVSQPTTGLFYDETDRDVSFGKKRKRTAEEQAAYRAAQRQERALSEPRDKGDSL